MQMVIQRHLLENDEKANKQKASFFSPLFTTLDSMRLPLIPLSPHIQTSCEYAKVLAQTTKALSEHQDNASVKSSLEKSLSKEREKLDRLTKSMQTIQSSCLLDFNMYDIAKEIAYINCSLFRLVTLDPAWLCNFDKQSNMVPLLDFHRYLSHSFAHQVIYGDPQKRSVMQLIHLAYILLHVYRDFSGCTAILTSLHMPQVRRLESMWAPCPAKLLQVYQQLVAMLSPDNNYEAYHHQLWLHTQRFLDTTPSKSQMIAVPFMHAHIAIIQNLVQTHASVQAAPDVVLSSAGQPLLASAVQLLEFCQQFSKMDSADLAQYAVMKRASTSSSSSNSKRASTMSNNSKAIKLSTSPCLDLDMLRSDANVYHWIVSRAYLTRAQLHAESLHVEPLAVGEIELESEEEHDLYWDFFDKQASVAVSAATVIKDSPPPPVLVVKSPKSPKQQQQQQQQDTVQATVDELDVVDSAAANEPSLVLGLAVDTPTATKDMEAASVQETVNCSNKDKDGRTVSEDLVVLQSPKEQQQATVEQDLPIATSKPVTHQQPSSNEAIMQQPIIKAKEPAAIDQEEQVPAHMEPAVLLSTTDVVAPVTTTLAYDNDDDDEDDIIIVTEEDDEEWTGYPLDSTPSQTVQDTSTEEEDEEWTGYPYTSQDEQDVPEKEEEEEEEVWKGYPIPSSEDDEQQHSNDDARKSPAVNVAVSSPVTPSEQQGSEPILQHKEWKGYQKTAQEEGATEQDNNSKHQLHAIGKAAARRMQYSLSSTDTNRKRLPSPFAPSSST